MRLSIWATILILAIGGAAAAAGVFPLEGAFGNAAGCHLYATGTRIGGYLLLTADTFSSTAVGCDFETLVSVENAVFTAKAICSPGGEKTVQVIDLGKTGYGLIVGAGSQIGPLTACAAVDLAAPFLRVKT